MASHLVLRFTTDTFVFLRLDGPQSCASLVGRPRHLVATIATWAVVGLPIRLSQVLADDFGLCKSCPMVLGCSLDAVLDAGKWAHAKTPLDYERRAYSVSSSFAGVCSSMRTQLAAVGLSQSERHAVGSAGALAEYRLAIWSAMGAKPRRVNPKG